MLETASRLERGRSLATSARAPARRVAGGRQARTLPGRRRLQPYPGELIPLIEAVPPIRGKRGQPLRRPRYLYADRGYDHDLYRDRVRRFEITPHIARRGIEQGSGLGLYRWDVEGTIALLHWFRRLRIRWEIRDDIHHAFVTLGCAVIYWRRLKPSL